MFLNSKIFFTFRGPIKYFESAPPELGRSGDGKQTTFQIQPCCKRVLKAAKLAYAMLIKQKSPSLPRKLAVGTFGELLIVFSTKLNLLHFVYSTAKRCCLLHLKK